MPNYLAWDGLEYYEVKSDEPLAPLSILAVDENMKSESAKGGPGSGHFGHGGREGKIGGSAPGKGSALGPVHKPKGYSDREAEQTADWLVNHPTGQAPPPGVERFMGDLQLGPKHETFRDWADDTLKKTRVSSLVDSGKKAGILSSSDAARLASIPDKSIWRSDRTLEVLTPERMPKADRRMLESEYGISRFAILPNIAPTGTWLFQAGKSGFGGSFVLKVSKGSPNPRKTFWHEFAHTVPDHTLSAMIGKRKKGETEGAYANRFAEFMSR